jgi:asparagine synthase (glutamine-hydrolysing)
MCAIAGYLRVPGATDRGQAPVQAMCAYMRRRGPHAEGLWQDDQGRAVLGHRRLAIIDLDARSNQPMQSAGGRHVIVFNGEIYNYRALRSELEAEGCVFRTGGDTEVILALWQRHGPAALTRLRGMYAFAVFDTVTGGTHLVRDPYGIKPLYYTQSPAGVLFASQVKALLATGHVSQTRDQSALVSFYLWGNIPEPRTYIQDIRAVPAGSYLEIADGRCGVPAPFAPLDRLWTAPADKPLRDEELAEMVGAQVRGSIEAHLVADRPICTFLSGGIDSGVIAAEAARHAKSSAGVTIVYDDFRGSNNDEGPPAKLVADAYGFKHTQRNVDAVEFKGDLDAIFAAMDQPTIDGVNTWFAAKATAELGYNVVLSGVGGDELMGGYPSFRGVPLLYRAGTAAGSIWGGGHLAGALGKTAARLLNKPKVSHVWPYGRTLEGAYFLQRGVFLPDELPDILGADGAREGMRQLAACTPDAEAVLKQGGWTALVSFLESTHYLRNQLLRDADWASMAHSLELRTPLVDYHLAGSIAPYARQITGAAGKTLLAHAPKTPLPAAIIQRKKTGFGLPMKRFMEAALPGKPWSRHGALSGPSVPWARQWAVTVAERFGYR